MQTVAKPARLRLARSAAWSVGGRLFQFLVGLVALAIIARMVEPQDYGIFALSWVVIGIGHVIVSTAPIDTLVQRHVLRPGHCNASFWAALGFAAIAWGLLWAGAGPLAGLLGGGAALAAILPLRAASIPLAAAAGVPTALLMRDGRFKAIAGAEAAASVVSSAVGIGAALAGAGVWSLVAMELTRQAAVTGGVWRLAAWRPGIASTRQDAHELLGFNARTWGAGCVAFGESQLPRLLIASVLGPQALGYFALAHRLYDQISSVLMVPAYQLVMAGVSQAQLELERVRRLSETVLRATAVVACPIFLGLAAVAPVLIPLVFGAHWADAVPIAQVLLLLGIRSSTSMVQIAVVRAMGRADWHLRSAVAGLALTTALVVPAAQLGLAAVALAVVLKAYLMWPLHAVMVRRLCGLSLSRQAAMTSGPLVASVAMFTGVALLLDAGAGVVAAGGAWAAIGMLTLAVLCGAAVYAAVIAVVAPDAVAYAAAAWAARSFDPAPAADSAPASSRPVGDDPPAHPAVDAASVPAAASSPETVTNRGSPG